MIDTIIDLFVNFDEERLLITIERALKAGIERNEIIKALNEALDMIEKKYEIEACTIADLMMASMLYERVIGMECIIAQPQRINGKKQGVILLATIESDLHDIGKSLFKSIALATGFKVIDLGVNVKSEVICDKISEYKPDIVGISIILTSAVAHLRETIERMQTQGLRSQIKVIVGGSVVDASLCKNLGVDAFTDDAVKGIEICQDWMKCDNG